MIAIIRVGHFSNDSNNPQDCCAIQNPSFPITFFCLTGLKFNAVVSGIFSHSLHPPQLEESVVICNPTLSLIPPSSPTSAGRKCCYLQPHPIPYPSLFSHLSWKKVLLFATPPYPLSLPLLPTQNITIGLRSYW